jgi:hypothetical protein
LARAAALAATTCSVDVGELGTVDFLHRSYPLRMVTAIYSGDGILSICNPKKKTMQRIYPSIYKVRHKSQTISHKPYKYKNFSRTRYK